jgi:hypothetical protein
MADQHRDLPKRSRVLAVEHVDVDADRNGQRGQDAKHGPDRDTSRLKRGNSDCYNFIVRKGRPVSPFDPGPGPLGEG